MDTRPNERPSGRTGPADNSSGRLRRPSGGTSSGASGGHIRPHRTLADATAPRITLPGQALVPREATEALEPTQPIQPEANWERGAWDERDEDAEERALVPVRESARSVELPESGGLIVRGTGRVSVMLRGKPREKASLKHRVPLRILGYVAAALVVGLAFAAPSLASTATASACDWYTVKPGDTLSDISAAAATTPDDVARANHGHVTDKIYVGEQLCLPTTWYAQAQASKYTVPVNAPVALPSGILAGEPCTADRAIVWTVPVSRWAVPPGCFGLIYHPNPRDYMVNGQVIGAFGWCNWWPEALLRNPNALNWPGHATPRVGYPVWYAPQPGQHLGHYAFVESIGGGANAGWLLISEMNMYWRGGGWAAVDYRYIRADYPGASYLYPN